MAHKQLNTFHLFAGAGGGILADLLLGHNPIGACEIEEYPRNVLLARQRDGILPEFPIWDDICTFDGKPWRGKVDVVCGGFPCQDISSAGKGAGIDGARSGLWGEMARVVREIQPRFVFVENSPMLTSRGLGRVLGDLAEMGYDARWCVLGACDAGAPHKRDRIWILAESRRDGTGSECGAVGNEERRASREYVPPLRQENGPDGADRTKPASEGKELADSDNNGQAAAEKPRGTIEGGNCGQTGSQSTCKSSRLCKQSPQLADSKYERPTGGREQYQSPEMAGDGGQVQSERGKQATPVKGGGANVPDSDEQRAQVSVEGGFTAEQMFWCAGGWWEVDPAELADTASERHRTRGKPGNICEKNGRSFDELRPKPSGSSEAAKESGTDRSTQPLVGRVAHGVAHRVDRLKAIGNGQTPQCAALAWTILSEGVTA